MQTNRVSSNSTFDPPTFDPPTSAPPSDTAASPALGAPDQSSPLPDDPALAREPEDATDTGVAQLLSRNKPQAPPASFFESDASRDDPGAPSNADTPRLTCEQPDVSDLPDDALQSEAHAFFQLSVRRYAPFHEFGGYFEGDAASRDIPRDAEGHGGFTTEPQATARVGTVVQVFGDQVAAVSHCDVSRHPLFGEAQAKPETIESSVTHGHAAGHIAIAHAASMPLLGRAPDIDTFVRADYEVTSAGLHVEGVASGDAFPNAEVFVSDSIGNSMMLSEFQTEYGPVNGPYGHLAGLGETFLGEFDTTIPLDAQGNFAMTCQSPENEPAGAP